MNLVPRVSRLTSPRRPYLASGGIVRVLSLLSYASFIKALRGLRESAQSAILAA